MLKTQYLEDIFIRFADLCDHRKIILSTQDWSAVQSFSNIISNNSQLTKNQANFIIKILQKYKSFAKNQGFDYSNDLLTPIWKNNFRVIDLSKKISVEKDEDGTVWILMKFPFALKEQFEKEISPIVKEFSSSIWDQENKVRKIKFYNFNTIEIFEFAQRHNFEIDDTFMIALADVEEMWENSEKIIPSSTIENNQVILVNAHDDAVSYFNQHKTKNINSDLMLAKSMGYILLKNPQTVVEKITSSEHTNFRLKNLDEFFEIYNLIDGPIAVITNKSDDGEKWVKDFCETSKKFHIPAEDIRICYRLDKQEDKGFNQWVKNNGYGGKVEGAKILIFQNKPPKWLFTTNISVKIILTNSLYPIPSATSQTWMDTHPCVCFVGNVRATGYKDKKIVEL